MSAKYKGAEKEYDFHHKPLWDWACDMLSDAGLVSYFQWDAQRLYKFDGMYFKRFYDEPWTGQRFWEIQVYNLLLIQIGHCDLEIISGQTPRGWQTILHHPVC